MSRILTRFAIRAQAQIAKDAIQNINNISIGIGDDEIEEQLNEMADSITNVIDDFIETIDKIPS